MQNPLAIAAIFGYLFFLANSNLAKPKFAKPKITKTKYDKSLKLKILARFSLFVPF